MRLLDGDVVAGLGLPMARKRLVEILVQLAGRVVGHVEQGDVRGEGGGLAQASYQGQCSGDLFMKHRFLSGREEAIE